MGEKRRQIPPWLLGLIIALVVFAAALVLLELLGYGDDPVLGSMPAGNQAGGGIGFPLQSMPSAGR